MIRAHHFKVFILFLTCTPWFSLADNHIPLIIGYGDHNAAPYAMERTEQLYNGIIKDIATEISGELDINISFVKTPRKRLERYLENNTIHLVLMTNPAWLSNNEKLQWSEPLFISKDILVVKANNPNTYNELIDLKGMVIGTIRGYKYPSLQPYFDNKDFLRYDVSNLTVNFVRLELGRIDALVNDDLLINYHLKISKDAHAFKVLPLIVSQHNIQAALSPNAPITLTQFNRALKKLKDQGVIAAIIKKYQIDQ